MSLNIYYSKEDVPPELKIVDRTSHYFDTNGVKLEDTEFVRNALCNIDNASIATQMTFTSNYKPEFGGIYKENLSNGCKTVLVVNLVSESDNICVDTKACGMNAYNQLLLSNRGNMLLGWHSITHKKSDRCDIIFDGKHCKNFGELADAIYERENN